MKTSTTSSNFHGANFLEVFSTQGNNVLQKLQFLGKKGGVKREFDKEVKTFIVAINPCTGNKGVKLACDHIFHRYLVVQLHIANHGGFTLELIVRTNDQQRRRLIFSSNFREIHKTEFHVQFPLFQTNTTQNGIRWRNSWLNICFDITELCYLAFSNTTSNCEFYCLDEIIINPTCKMRKIFTLKKNPVTEVIIPHNLQFTSGVNFDTLLVDGKHFTTLCHDTPLQTPREIIHETSQIETYRSQARKSLKSNQTQHPPRHIPERIIQKQNPSPVHSTSSTLRSYHQPQNYQQHQNQSHQEKKQLHQSTMRYSTHHKGNKNEKPFKEERNVMSDSQMKKSFQEVNRQVKLSTHDEDDIKDSKVPSHFLLTGEKSEFMEDNTPPEDDDFVNISDEESEDDLLGEISAPLGRTNSPTLPKEKNLSDTDEKSEDDSNNTEETSEEEMFIVNTRKGDFTK